MVEHLKEDGLLVKIDENYTHRIGLCYKSNTVIEPLPMTQWFVKVKPLTDATKKAIKEKKMGFVPKRFEKLANQWLTNFHDWNISRQLVWGIRIPAWKCEDCSNWIITEGETPAKCSTCGGGNLQRDTDTFDTWFSSGQWPFATLQATSDKRLETGNLKNSDPASSLQSPVSDFDYFYPTSVMETGYDILPWWVCRMAMLGLYMTSDVPFKTVYLHGLVRDAKGQKMSKSKGNVINPLKMVDLYGADALRFSLIFGTAAGNDQALSEDKIRGMRNFANKLWNIGRFILMNREQAASLGVTIPKYSEEIHKKLTDPNDKRIITELNMLVAKTTKCMENYRLSDAAKGIYDFAWHRLADVHLEKNKERFKANDPLALSVLQHVFMTILKMLHPFIPFVTEEIAGKIQEGSQKLLITSPWPGIK